MLKQLLRSAFSVLILLCFSLSVNGQTCITGGPGSTSCHHATGGFWGLFAIEKGVSCGAGYYACCWDAGAKCIPTSSGGGGGDESRCAEDEECDG